jgi:hypothetical protein
MILRIFAFYPCWFLLINCWNDWSANSGQNKEGMQIPSGLSSLQLSIVHMMNDQPLNTSILLVKLLQLPASGIFSAIFHWKLLGVK